MAQKRVQLTLAEKVRVIQASNGRSHRQLADEFKIGRTQVGSILKRKREIMEFYEKSSNPSVKKRCTMIGNSNLDEAMFAWFAKMRSLHRPVSGPMLQAKALAMAKELNIPNFRASGGWLWRFKNRHAIASPRVSGKRADIDSAAVEDWVERLPIILEGYSPGDIFSMGETGLYYRALPDRTLSVRQTETEAGKKSKERLTVSLCCNMVGEFERTLVVGKAARPTCLGHADCQSLPITWRHSKKSWMTTALFEEWVRSFDRRMSSQGRRVLLLLDNAPCHPKDITLESIKLVHLPANATSFLQPLDLGIIDAVKLHYRRRLLEYVIRQANTQENLLDIQKSVDVELAIYWLHEAVATVKRSMVQTCFQKAGVRIPEEARLVISADEEDEDVPLGHLIREAQGLLHMPEPLTPEEYLRDSNCPSHDPMDMDWEQRLIEEAKAKDEEHNDDDDGDDNDVSNEHNGIIEPVAPVLGDRETVGMHTTLSSHLLHQKCSDTFMHVKEEPNESHDDHNTKDSRYEEPAEVAAPVMSYSEMDMLEKLRSGFLHNGYSDALIPVKEEPTDHNDGNREANDIPQEPAAPRYSDREMGDMLDRLRAGLVNTGYNDTSEDTTMEEPDDYKAEENQPHQPTTPTTLGDRETGDMLEKMRSAILHKGYSDILGHVKVENEENDEDEEEDNEPRETSATVLSDSEMGDMLEKLRIGLLHKGYSETLGHVMSALLAFPRERLKHQVQGTLDAFFRPDC